MSVLVSWVGSNDLNGYTNNQGPILSLLSGIKFDSLVLLYNYPSSEVMPFIEHVKQKCSVPLETHFVALSSPTDYTEITQSVEPILSSLAAKRIPISIFLTPGTPAMQAVWVLLGKTKFQAEFYESSREQGVQKVSIPFDISAEFIPLSQVKSVEGLVDLAYPEVPINSAFDDILANDQSMLDLKQQATMMAGLDVSVLITGETGTGKEMFATAIHNASDRKDKPFKTLNCGAIPVELIDSVLFGHKKGAFTGAHSDKKGLFELADGGTVFLDEFGELSKDAQVRLLRVLQSGEITPVGADNSMHVKVKVICATNKNLMEAIQQGQFREDLFYRVAVGLIRIPPLRARGGDVGYLADSLLDQIENQLGLKKDYKGKKLSPSAKNIILSHNWPGNIRELHSTLTRACLWAGAQKISSQILANVMFEKVSIQTDLMNRQFGNSFNIQELIDDLVRKYIVKAMEESNDKKKKAAELLGLKSYQVLDSWIKKHNVDL